MSKIKNNSNITNEDIEISTKSATDAPENVTEEVVVESTDVTTEDTFEKTTEESSDVATEEIAEEVAEATTTEATDVTAEEIAEEVADTTKSEDTDVTAEEIVEEITEKSTDIIAEETPEEGADITKEQTSDSSIEDTADVTTEESAEPATIALADDSAEPDDYLPPVNTIHPSADATLLPTDNKWVERALPVAVLCAICMISALLLSLTNSITKPIIDANTASEEQESMRVLIPDAETFTKSELSTDLTTLADSAYVALTGEDVVGYIVSVKSKGYGGDVPILVSFDANGAIGGINIGANSETPGIGDRIYDETFLGQFVGLTTELAVTEYDGITGATYSSGAVYESVNKAITVVNSLVGEGE